MTSFVMTLPGIDSHPLAFFGKTRTVMPVWLSNAVLARVPLRLANWSLVHALTVVNSCVRGLCMGFSGSSWRPS